jgi:hypothetical protein
VNEWTKCSTPHTNEYYTVTERDKRLIYSINVDESQKIKLSERSQILKTTFVLPSLILKSTKGKTSEMENTLLVGWWKYSRNRLQWTFAPAALMWQTWAKSSSSCGEGGGPLQWGQLAFWGHAAITSAEQQQRPSTALVPGTTSPLRPPLLELLLSSRGGLLAVQPYHC